MVKDGEGGAVFSEQSCKRRGWSKAGVPLWFSVPYLGFYCCDKTPWPKPIWDRPVNSQSIAHQERKLRQELKKTPKNIAYGLVPLVLLSLPLSTPQDHPPRGGTAQKRMGSFTSITRQENAPIELPIRWMQSLSWGSLFPAWFKLGKHNQHASGFSGKSSNSHQLQWPPLLLRPAISCQGLLDTPLIMFLPENLVSLQCTSYSRIPRKMHTWKHTNL